ncbi:MAG TPA: TIGR03000 domain-containing protein [Gemmataceae bacterium]|nr:TIGR03000 domain-containing protein [Gemmataceae bacterium]
MPLPPGPPGMDGRCSPFETLGRGEYTVENNTWGAFQVSAYSQCVYAAPASAPGPRFAWTWDYPRERADEVKAFPELIHGKKPWAWTSTTPRLPRPVSPAPSLKVDFALRTEATGRYNAAFEIWLTRSPIAAGEPDVSHEVMFWVGSGGDPAPVGLRAGTVTLADGRPCDLWVGRIKTWDFFGFVFRQPFSEGVLECGYYLEYLLREGKLPPDIHIASLEFGNEIWHGSGRTMIDRYQVTVGDRLHTPAARTALDPDRAYVQLDVPGSAIVFIEDVLMRSTSARRLFRSPPIARDRDHVYRVRVVDGPREASRQVVVRAGSVASVSFADLGN